MVHESWDANPVKPDNSVESEPFSVPWDRDQGWGRGGTGQSRVFFVSVPLVPWDSTASPEIVLGQPPIPDRDRNWRDDWDRDEISELKLSQQREKLSWYPQFSVDRLFVVFISVLK